MNAAGGNRTLAESDAGEHPASTVLPPHPRPTRGSGINCIHPQSFPDAPLPHEELLPLRGGCCALQWDRDLPLPEVRSPPQLQAERIMKSMKDV